MQNTQTSWQINIHTVNWYCTATFTHPGKTRADKSEPDQKDEVEKDNDS
jgi:hypothetical protein